jgi:alanine racemase
MLYPFERTGAGHWRWAPGQGVSFTMTDGARAAGPRAVIDLAALRANARTVARRAAGREWIAVVKADAYGHGVVPVARELLGAGAACLAVFTADEACELRAAGLAGPLLVLAGPRDAHEADAIVAADAAAVLHHDDGFAQISQAARRAGARARVQIEVDTGMRRMGVREEDVVALVDRIDADERCELEGVFTHFACADEPDPAPSLEQCARFRRVLEALGVGGRRAGLVVHAANSAALLTPEILAALPEATAVRPGLMLYGVQPAAHLAPVGLEAVMSLRAPVVRIHDVASGEGVGYGASWRAAAPTRVATVALGYEDGLAWTASNRGSIWLAGERRSIVGRVSMDSVGIEIGDAPVAIGEEAVFFGPAPEGAAAIRVEQAAAEAGTLHYELLVRVGRRVRREYVNARGDRSGV